MSTTEPAKLSFESDIKPLFRDKDRQAMLRAFDLWSYPDVVANAEAISEQLSEGTMPCDGAWPDEQVKRFQEWVDEGGPE
jgi:hypothetical protein